MTVKWNQPKCDGCYARENPGREPARMIEDVREEEQCSACGKLTTSGIYVRQDPASVLYPAREPELWDEEEPPLQYVERLMVRQARDGVLIVKRERESIGHAMQCFLALSLIQLGMSTDDAVDLACREQDINIHLGPDGLSINYDFEKVMREYQEEGSTE